LAAHVIQDLRSYAASVTDPLDLLFCLAMNTELQPVLFAFSSRIPSGEMAFFPFLSAATPAWCIPFTHGDIIRDIQKIRSTYFVVNIAKKPASDSQVFMDVRRYSERNLANPERKVQRKENTTRPDFVKSGPRK